MSSVKSKIGDENLMAQLKEVFKTREEICLWLKEHKEIFEEKIGFKLKFISTVELGILAEIDLVYLRKLITQKI